MNHPTEDQIVFCHYGDCDAETRQEVERHMATCPACRGSYDRLKQVLAAVDTIAGPERSENYEAEVWQRLRPQLPAPVRTWWSAWLRPQRWALAGAVTAMLVVAFLAGRYSQPPQTSTAAVISPTARERILLVALGDHLDRSQMLLVELVNADGKGKVNIAPEQQRAEDLVASNRLYRQTAARAGEAGLANVLDELERTLIQIAHSPTELTPDQLDQIRRRIEAQGILFKVRVISTQVREKEKASVQDPARRAL